MIRYAFNWLSWMNILVITFLIVASCAITTAPSEGGEHVYYCYVPPSSDLPELIELIDGKQYNYTPPPGTALLDVVAIHDDTKVDIVNIVTGEVMYSFTLDALEWRTLPISFGTFFKVVSNKRIMASLVGGSDYPSGLTAAGHGTGGTGVIYPAADGGFIGKYFVIVPVSVTSGLVAYEAGYNALILGIESTEFEIVDSVKKWSLKASVKQQEAKRYSLWCRIMAGFPPAIGPGNSMVFTIKSRANIMVTAVNTGCLVAVPALSGGFAGKMFYIPAFFSYEMVEGCVAAIVVVPTKACKVEVYDARTMDKIAEKSFSERDVEADAVWFYKLGRVRDKEYIIASEAPITLLAGSTLGGEDIQHLGPDVTFMGARPGETIKFYVPTLGVVFTPEDAELVIDGKTLSLKADSYILLDQGVHTLRSNKVVIIELVSSVQGLSRWGTYLIEPLDITKEFKVPEGFGKPKGGFPIWIITVVVLVTLVCAFLVLRKRRARRP